MNKTSSKKHRPASGQFFVVRALDRSGHTRAGAVALARRRIACGGPGHSHALLVVQVEAVVRLKRVSAITVEEIR
jgi:hypothetical protein